MFWIHLRCQPESDKLVSMPTKLLLPIQKLQTRAELWKLVTGSITPARAKIWR